MNGVPSQMRILIPQYLRQTQKQTLALQIRNMVATSTNGQQYQQPFEKLQVVTSTNGQQHQQPFGKLEGEDYDRFLNSSAKTLELSLIRRLCSLQTHSPPGTHFLACGLPNPSLFPFKEAKLTLKSGETITLDGKLIDDAQQYTETTGYSPLVKQVKELVVRYHNPPNLDNSDFIITIGAQDGFTRAMSLLLSPGDFVITENPTFTGMLSAIKQYDVNILGVKSDAFGMIPESLEEILSSKWDPNKIRKAQTGIPKVLYINPTGSNPSGVSSTRERKEKIYELARLYNILIIEDDPYYFIEFRDPKTYADSFLSMDTDGRVLRFDSFSKLIASGLRIGFLTGPKELVLKYLEHMEATTLQASTLSQVIASELLKKWSTEGLETHIENIRQFYRKQRDAMNAAAEKYLKGLCEWNIPTGGMFLWIKVLVLDDVEEMVLKRGPSKGLILMPGNPFMVDHNKPCPYVRLSYSFSSASDLEEACKLFADLIREEVELCSKQKTIKN
ncbi:UNVERIFIED_CONTAM: hypothetical protein RMT77_007619 [Armadillidium vulgare]